MVEEFWSEFVRATGISGPYLAWAFGDPESCPALSTELALLVRDGPKRATAGLLSEYEDGPETDPMPQPRDVSVILDGSGAPACVIRTTAVEVRRFGDVDEAFAWEEGEGDRTLSWWREAHIAVFRERGTPIDENSEMILERFELLYPMPQNAAGEGTPEVV